MIPRWELLGTLRRPLLDWYDVHRRILPWREEPSPYRTWISEIMLQQTRVTAVIPYFDRFIAELPDVAALAFVDEERLFKLWEGLGYYSRARNLQRAARLLVERYGGALPHTMKDLRLLPGIGDYTAAAIASIHFGVCEPAVDGNLLRVAARVCGCAEDVTTPGVKRRFRLPLAKAIDRERPGVWNQAMMDLGATICLPNGAPLCADCPARVFCVARREGLTTVLPVRGKKKKRRAEERTVFLLLRDGRLAVRRRPDAGLLAGLTEFPNVSGNLDEPSARAALARWGLLAQTLTPLRAAKHVFTHIEWQLKGYAADVTGDAPEDFRWVSASDFASLAFPTAFRTYATQAHELLKANG